MKKLVLCVLIVNIVNVNCGLLKQVLTPVTESVQNNDLLDKQKKEKEPEKKGMVTNVVEELDALTDPLTGLLNQGKKENDASKNETKNDTKAVDNKNPDVKDKLNDTKSEPKIDTKTVDNKSPDVQDKLNETKNATKDVEAAKDNLSTTPSTDEKLNTAVPGDKDCKGDGCTEKPKADADVDVTKRVNFDGNQCPTGTERAHDDTCKEVQ